MVPTPGVSVTADPIKADFRNHLFLVWKHLGLPPPTPVQYDIAHYLQHGPRRKMVMAFRGVGKSWVYAAFVTWRLYCDPDCKLMVVSASKPLADSFSTFVKRLINEIPHLQHLSPREGQRDSNIAFDVGPAAASKDPSVKSVGITGQITGSRADEIIADDVESLNNSATHMQREKLAALIKEFDAVLKPGGTITYLGTPQTEQSIYKQLPERGYTIRVWTARVPGKTDTYSGQLAPFIDRMIASGSPAGTPVDPKRFSDLDLIEREASYGRSGFAMQFMLDTSLSDGDRHPLRVSDLIVTSLDSKMAPGRLVWCNDPDRAFTDLPNVALPGDRFFRPLWVADKDTAEYEGAVMWVDPSGRGKDETGWAVVKQLNGTLFLTAAGGFRGGYEPATLKAISEVAKAHQVKLLAVESNFGDGMFTQLLKPVLKEVYQVAVEEFRSKGQKEARIIETLEPLMNQHRLVVDAGVIRADYEGTKDDPRYSLVYQMTRLTKDRGSLPHDDRIEAVAGACQYWVETMARSQDKAHEDTKKAQLKAKLDDFMASYRRSAIQTVPVPPKRSWGGQRKAPQAR
ncbi:hypothetical protein UFOVP347_42 [uncultured Caudovirales phage]|uniref:Terminase, large subunit n=1 Tax=uncultured Caudovirales phage TaxID=2100421 RepID=A0A6J5M6Y2_9CAUD|nr:hypothetical protein UFOVP347_42 [uncultured Caudovirales phage]